jgi:hypothetical protein
MKTFDYKHLLPEGFDPGSRVWIYQASRPFNAAEASEVEGMLREFAENWTSHGAPVKGFGALLFDQFIVLMADERAAGVSGCSTDSSVHLIKAVEQKFDVELFDRLALAFIVDEEVRAIPLPGIVEAIKAGFISADTIYFNNIVSSKEELENRWMIPIRESWLARQHLV